MTNPTSDARPMVPVVQADRDAAAAMWLSIFPHRGGEAKVIKDGNGDDGPIAQTLARHRSAFATPTRLPDREAIARALASRFIERSEARVTGSLYRSWDEMPGSYTREFLEDADAIIALSAGVEGEG